MARTSISFLPRQNAQRNKSIPNTIPYSPAVQKSAEGEQMHQSLRLGLLYWERPFFQTG